MNLVVPAENFAIAKNETNFTIKLNIWQFFSAQNQYGEEEELGNVFEICCSK